MFIYDGATPADVPDVVWESAGEIFREALRVGGTLTGEHGVGTLKRRFLAEELGDAGGGGLKKLVTAAVNDYFAPIRARRAELVADPGYLERVLAAGNQRATAVADRTLDEVRQAMRMVY